MKLSYSCDRSRILSAFGGWLVSVTISSCGRVDGGDASAGSGGFARGGASSSASTGAGAVASGGALGGGGVGGTLTSASGGVESGGAAPGMGASGGAAGNAARGGVTGAGGERACGALIDDMEDATGHICTGNGRMGVWYAFKDDGSSQWPAPTQAGIPIESSLIPEGRADSRRAIHTYGSAAGWGAGVGFDLHFDGANYGVYDVQRYSGIQFWARGTGSAVTFRLSTQSGTSVQYGGTCTAKTSDTAAIGSACAGGNGPRLKVGPEWVKYTVPFSELSQGSPNELDRTTNVQFKIGDETRGTLFYPKYDFWIDDVSFVEGEPNCCSALPACQGGVHASDPALQRALTGSDDASVPLSCAKVCSLRFLSARGAGIRDLHGLECLSALDTLSLPDNAIDDLSPLAGLTALRDIDLSNNRLENLKGLASLHNLANLQVSNNQLTSLSDLTRLDHLAVLDVRHNQLTDAQSLAGLHELEQLNLDENQLASLPPLDSLASLVTLTLSTNSLVDVGPLARLSALTRLELKGNQVENVVALGGLSQLKTLIIAQNRVNDLGSLLSLANLESLDASQNAVRSLGVVSGSIQLTSLDLSENQLSDVSPLAALVSLRILELNHNSISNTAPLGALSQLNRLGLAGNVIHALPPPFHLTGLRWLDLSNNGLTTLLVSFAGQGFENLNVSNNQIQSLEAFAGIILLTHGCTPRCGNCCQPGALDLSHNQVSDLAPLLRQDLGDAYVNLTDNRLVCAEQALNIQALRAAGVALGLDEDCQ